MRLIDADLQYNRLADELKWLMQYGDDVYLAVAEALRKEPTAYDIDKVVDELEKAKTINVDVGFGTIINTIRKDVILEIVKEGGLVD